MKKVAILFFTGTGNTSFVTNKIKESFSLDTIVDLYSIEKHPNASGIPLEDYDIVGLGYPIYGSSLPKIVRDFIQTIPMMNKEAFTFCTQLIFSGDGAAYGARLLKKRGFIVSYQEHFRMPNNLTDLGLFSSSKPLKYELLDKRITVKALKFVSRIESKSRYTKGSNPFSLILGLSQRVFFEKYEPSFQKKLRIDEHKCTVCKLCTLTCPTGSLSVEDGKIKYSGNCTLCYRCLNLCPEQAIFLMTKKGVKSPYLGPTPDFKIMKFNKDVIHHEVDNESSIH